jgi:hypothetical protein
MDKIQKVSSRLLVVFFVIITIYSMVVMNYCSGKDKKMEKEISLISEYKLDLADRIIIETRKRSYNSYQKKVITDLKTIEFIVNELKNINEIDGIATWCDYNITFFKDNEELLKLGLRISLDPRGSSFIRHWHDTVDDYRISKSFHDFFVDILNLATEPNK